MEIGDLYMVGYQIWSGGKGRAPAGPPPSGVPGGAGRVLADRPSVVVSVSGVP